MEQNLLFSDKPTTSPKAEKPKDKPGRKLLMMLEQYKDFIDILDEDDFSNDDMRLVSDIFGPEIAFLILAELGGLQLNVPKSGLNKIREKYIKKHFDGSNAKTLSVRCRCSQSFVYSCLR